MKMSLNFRGLLQKLALSLKKKAASDEDLEWLDEVQFRTDSLSPEEMMRYEQLSERYNDALDRTVDQPLEQVLPGERDEFSEDSDEFSPGDIDLAQERADGQIDRLQGRDDKTWLREMLTRQMLGEELTPDQQARIKQLQQGNPEIFDQFPRQELQMVGLDPDQSDTDKIEVPTTEELAAQFTLPTSSPDAPDFLDVTTGEVIIDPQVASENERFGKSYGVPTVAPSFIKENLSRYHQWMDALKSKHPGMDASVSALAPGGVRPVSAPLYYSSGERAVPASDLKARLNEVSRSLHGIEGMKPEDISIYTKAFDAIIQNPGKYDLNAILPQFQQALVSKGVDPVTAIEAASEIQATLTKEKSMDDYYWLEKARLLEEKMKSETDQAKIEGRPVPQQIFEKNYERIQSMMDNLGSPIDLMALTRWVQKDIRNSERLNGKRRTGQTLDGKTYEIDQPEALIAAYDLITQSPIPNKTKKRVADILMDPNDYRIQVSESGERIPQSKLQAVQQLLTNSALIQHGLGVHKDGWRDFSKQDEMQQMEKKLIAKTYDELTDTVRRNFRLTHGQALDYLRNTKEGLDLFYNVLNSKTDAARKKWEKEHGFRKVQQPGERSHVWVNDRDIDPTQQQFLKQFPYGPSEMFMLLNSTPENRERNPNQPHIPLSGPEIDSGVMKNLRRLWRNPEMFEKMFPGTINVPTKVKDPQTGETRLVMKERPRSEIITDPVELQALQMMIEKERKGEGDIPGRMYAPMGERRKRSRLSLRPSLDLRALAGPIGQPEGKYYNQAQQPGSGDFSSLLRGISDALGPSHQDLIGDILSRFNKQQTHHMKGSQVLPELNALYSTISEGYKGDVKIPKEAIAEARSIMLDSSKSILDKYTDMDNLWRYRIQTPEMDDVIWQKTEFGPHAEISAKYIAPTRHPREAIQKSLSDGSPLPGKSPASDQPKEPAPFRRNLRLDEPVETPEMPDFLRRPGKSTFKFMDEVGGESAPPGQGFDDAVNEVAGGEPENQSPSWDDLLNEVSQPDRERLASRLSLRKKRAALSLRKYAFSPEDYVVPSDESRLMMELYNSADEDTREQYLRPQDEEYFHMHNVLSGLSDPQPYGELVKRYQGGEEPDPFNPGATRPTSGIFDWPIIDKMRDRGYFTKGKKPAPPPEESSSEGASPAPSIHGESPSQEEDVPEHVALSDIGSRKLEELRESAAAGQNMHPDLLNILELVDSYTREGYPIRSQEELEDLLQHHPDKPGVAALRYATGDNPDGFSYVQFFQDNKGQFDPPDNPRNKNLIEDPAHLVRNTFTRGPMTDEQWNRMTPEEQMWVEQMRTPQRPAYKMPDVYQYLLQQYNKFQKMQDTPPTTDYERQAYNAAQTRAAHAIDMIKKLKQNKIEPNSPLTLDQLTSSELVDDLDKKFLQDISPTYSKRPFSGEFFNQIRQMAYPPEEQPELWRTPESMMARRLVEKGVIPNADMPRGHHWESDPRKLPGYFNQGDPMSTRFWEEREKWIPQGKKRTSESSVFADVTGPGGPEWSYEYTSGPTPAADSPLKRKLRFPFHNAPAPTAGGIEGEQGNIVNSKPGAHQMDNIEATFQGLQKTADNELFNTYSYTESPKGLWFTLTLFKRAYSTFKDGDLVIQYGATPQDAATFRRRFGSSKKAEAETRNSIRTILAIMNPGVPTPGDSLSEVQTGAPSFGPYKKRIDYDAPEGANRDGFNRPAPRKREDTERNLFPYEDSELSNMTSALSGFIAPASMETGMSSPDIGDTPEDRAWQPQDVPNRLNLSNPHNLPKRKRMLEKNETGISGEYSGNPKIEMI